MKKSSVKKPKIGSKIYVPTQWYIDRCEDDISGGLATIIKYEKCRYSDEYWVVVKEIPNQFSLSFLLANQVKWKKEYGRRKARPDPDVV